MSTTMTELNRRAAVVVFRASLPRRGAKGRNDLASAAEALRQMERRVEAVRALGWQYCSDWRANSGGVILDHRRL